MSKKFKRKARRYYNKYKAQSVVLIYTVCISLIVYGFLKSSYLTQLIGAFLGISLIALIRKGVLN